MDKITFSISKSSNGACSRQNYVLPYQSGKTVFWWLTKIQEELDSSLAFPVSCRGGLCGGCGIRVNGKSILGCETMVDEQREILFVDPLQGFPVISDLLVDWLPARERMKKFSLLAGVQQDNYMNSELKLTPEECNKQRDLGLCITCGLCASECPALSSGLFLEPYIFVKSQKRLTDPRINEESKGQLAQALIPYLNYCISCSRCDAVCPRRLSPKAAVEFIKNRYY